MFFVNHKLRFRINLSCCASGVRFLRAPRQVWRSIIYGFHTTGLLNIRRKYRGYNRNTKVAFCDSWHFIPKKLSFLQIKLFNQKPHSPSIPASRIL